MKNSLFFLALTLMLTCLIFLPQSVKGKVIYTDINPDTTLDQSNKFFEFDLNGDGTKDFYIKYFDGDPSQLYLEAYSEMGTQSELLVGELDEPYALALNDTISQEKSKWLNSSQNEWSSTALDMTPHWIGKENHCLGLRVQVDGNWYYGWMRISVPQDTSKMVIFDYAYENKPDFGIKAGSVEPLSILVESISVAAQGGINAISTKGGTLQINATVQPNNAEIKTVKWSIDNSDIASINNSGLLTAKTNGSVTVTASATDKSGVFCRIAIVITGQETLVSSITVRGENDRTEIDTNNGILQMFTNVLPPEATNKIVKWSVNDTTIASIDVYAKLRARKNGTVTVKATATDNSGVWGSTAITIKNQKSLTKSIAIISENGKYYIDKAGGTLNLSVLTTPDDATDKSVSWSIDNNELATIDVGGILTAKKNGTVIVKAMANDGSNVQAVKNIVITNQKISVTGITINSESGSFEITVKGGTLQMIAQAQPTDADDKTVTWSIDNNQIADISAAGLVTAKRNGSVVVTAAANDGSNINKSVTVEISNQKILVQSITVQGTGGATTLTGKDATLLMIANVLPDNAEDKSITWTVDNSQIAEISDSGLLTAKNNGFVTVTAIANDESQKTGTTQIEVTGITSVLDETGQTLEIYPNPAKKEINIKSNNPLTTIRIIDIRGETESECKTANNEIFIDISNLNNGIYFIQIGKIFSKLEIIK